MFLPLPILVDKPVGGGGGIALEVDPAEGEPFASGKF